jgi:hypothetical protein
VTGLPERVRELLAEAVAEYAGRPAGRRLAAVAGRLDEPLRVALAGRVKAGKSTLLNALVGARVAATDAGECTRVVTWYAHAGQPRAVARLRAGHERTLPLTGDGGSWVPDLGLLRADDLDRLRVELPTDWLAAMTLIDTPGLGSLSTGLSGRTRDLLSAADPGADDGVDAVVYLLRHLHTTDVDFLEVFHEAQFSDATPINAVGVLSRADETGGGRPDAMRHARRVAAGYRQDPRFRALVQTVVPVAGLLAEAATGLAAADVAALNGLAALAPGATGPMLLSADRFAGVAGPGGAAGPGGRDEVDPRVDPTARQRLLDLLGMYGIRLALDGIRRAGRPLTGTELGELLTVASGLPRLRRLLLTQFAQRRDVLKADSALRAIDNAARVDPVPAAARLRQRVERIRAGAHELAELRLLTELRTGQVPAAPDRLADLERLLGGDGTAPATRLGLAGDADRAAVSGANTAQHARWQQVARNPLTPPALARAATVAVRTCEGLAAGPPVS